MSEKIDINKIAKLARLNLSESESHKLEKYFEQIVKHIDQLNELDTSNIEPTSHVLPIQNIFRDDEALKSSGVDFLSEAPSNKKGHYEVPKII